MLKDIQNRIFNIDYKGFEKLAIEIFNYQYLNNKVYHNFVDTLKIKPNTVNTLNKIPFLPIDLFKSHKILNGDINFEKTFESSGTTDADKSMHYVKSLDVYVESFSRCFNLFYGDVNDYCIIGLLPSYLERDNSSLVYMVDNLIKMSNNADSGFYLNNYDELIKTLKALEAKKQKTILFGVSYALLDIAEIIDFKLQYTNIIETGGMKGRREELPKKELHNILKKAFVKKQIHSEYGMTELLSQAYSLADGIFKCPPWMRVLIRDTYDPMTYNKPSVTGGINIIDLANINSCCFIESKDLGKLYTDNSFEVLGRFDNSDIRGCNLMVD